MVESGTDGGRVKGRGAGGGVVVGGAALMGVTYGSQRSAKGPAGGGIT